jgi:hypothetical protein
MLLHDDAAGAKYGRNFESFFVVASRRKINRGASESVDDDLSAKSS